MADGCRLMANHKEIFHEPDTSKIALTKAYSQLTASYEGGT